MSGIIDRLEVKGFVARLPNPNDKRTIFISITSKGEKLLSASPQLLHQRLSSRLEKFQKRKLNKSKKYWRFWWIAWILIKFRLHRY